MQIHEQQNDFFNYNYLKTSLLSSSSNNNIIKTTSPIYNQSNLIQNHRMTKNEEFEQQKFNNNKNFYNSQNLNEILILENPSIELDDQDNNNNLSNNHYKSDVNFLSQSEDDFGNEVFLDEQEDATTYTAINDSPDYYENYRRESLKRPLKISNINMLPVQYFNRQDSKRCNLTYSLSTSSTDLVINNKTNHPLRPYREKSEKTILQKSTNSLIRTLQNKWSSFENHLNRTDSKLEQKNASSSNLATKKQKSESVKGGIVENMKKKFLNSTSVSPTQSKIVKNNHSTESESSSTQHQPKKYHKIGNINLNLQNYNYYQKQQQQQQIQLSSAPTHETNGFNSNIKKMTLSIDDQFNSRNLVSKMLNKLDTSSNSTTTTTSTNDSQQTSRRQSSVNIPSPIVNTNILNIDQLHEKIKYEISELKKDDEILKTAFEQIRKKLQDVTNTINNINKIDDSISYEDESMVMSNYNDSYQQVESNFKQTKMLFIPKQSLHHQNRLFGVHHIKHEV